MGPYKPKKKKKLIISTKLYKVFSSNKNTTYNLKGLPDKANLRI